MSIGSILNMARTGMAAQQTAIQIASQNISNAETDGYSRQRVELSTSLPTVFPYGAVGTGVQVTSITRARDSLLDATYRTDNGNATNAQTLNDSLTQIQGVFGEPSDNGLAASMDAFWSSWSNLANDPTNSAAKSVVLQSGQDVATTLNRYASQLDGLDSTNRQSISNDVGQINSIVNQIADYNRQIVPAEASGQPANDLRDARDKLLDQLSTLVGGQVVEHQNGTVAVYTGGRMLVDNTTVKQLQLNNSAPPTISYVGSPAAIDGIGGSLGAKLDISANRIPAAMAQLDSLAKGLVQTVNTIHSSGQVYSGDPPVGAPAGNFFDVTNPPPAGGDPLLTARNIRLGPTMTSASAVATAGAAATGPGNTDVATQLAALRDAPVTFTDASGATIDTTSFGDFYQTAVGDVATATQQSGDDATVQQTLVSNAQTRRQSVSGVSTDEELISVIQHQQAYSAAARLVSVVSDMTDTLVNLGR